MKLSILICSLHIRKEKLFKLLDGLLFQVGENYRESTDDKDYLIEKYISKDVEVIVCTDAKMLSVGKKRNMLVKAASGEYISFVDDDDKVSGNYVAMLLQKISLTPDVIVFDAVRYHNGKMDRAVKYGIEFKKDSNTPKCYFRIPNHLMCVKRELAAKVPFIDISFGEDANYAQRILPLLKSQERINETIYEYWYDDKLTETGSRK